MIDICTLQPTDTSDGVVSLPWSRKFLVIAGVRVNWPWQIEHKGKSYFNTGKEGTSVVDGCPSAEYNCPDNIKVWLRVDGQVQEE